MKNKNIKQLSPPATIGLIGGGQLGRMLVFEAKRMGFNVIVLDPKTNSPAGQVADDQIVAGFDDIKAYRELAFKSDVITFEFEHIDVKVLSLIESEGAKVIPSSQTLEVIQNKYRQKTMLSQLGVRVPKFSKINSFNDLEDKFEQFNQRAILKACTQGYDGKGNMILKSVDDLKPAYQSFENQEIIIEEWIEYIMELSIVVVRNEWGVYFYPVSENIHQDSILIKSFVPAAIPDEVTKKIQAVSQKIVESFDDYGMFCIEYFLDKNFEIMVNEIAPRPHNSGHYTIEACSTSQYEQLVRVICGLPTGSTSLIKPCVMYNILGNIDVTGDYMVQGLEKLLEIEECHFHLYGKSNSNHLKKMGHITVLGETREIADRNAKEAFHSIRIVQNTKM